MPWGRVVEIRHASWPCTPAARGEDEGRLRVAESLSTWVRSLRCVDQALSWSFAAENRWGGAGAPDDDEVESRPATPWPIGFVSADVASAARTILESPGSAIGLSPAFVNVRRGCNCPDPAPAYALPLTPAPPRCPCNGGMPLPVRTAPARTGRTMRSWEAGTPRRGRFCAACLPANGRAVGVSGLERRGTVRSRRWVAVCRPGLRAAW